MYTAGERRGGRAQRLSPESYLDLDFGEEHVAFGLNVCDIQIHWSFSIASVVGLIFDVHRGSRGGRRGGRATA